MSESTAECESCGQLLGLHVSCPWCDEARVLLKQADADNAAHHIGATLHRVRLIARLVKQRDCAVESHIAEMGKVDELRESLDKCLAALQPFDTTDYDDCGGPHLAEGITRMGTELQQWRTGERLALGVHPLPVSPDAERIATLTRERDAAVDECRKWHNLAAEHAERFMADVVTTGQHPNALIAELPMKEAPPGPHKYEPTTKLPEMRWGEPGATTTSLVDAFPKEQARCRDLLTRYEELGPVGTFGTLMIRAMLSRAEKAAAQQDTVAMLRIYVEMQETK